MKLDPEVTRIGLPSNTTNPTQGQVKWAPARSIWYSAMLVTGIVGGYLTFSLEALALCKRQSNDAL